MSAALAGDPASCSQAGGSLRRLATALRDAEARMTTGFDDPELAWSGRAATTARRSWGRLSLASRTLADELDRVGSQLQDHAADLAEAVHVARHVEDRAAAAGLRQVDGRLTPAWGVTGVADSAAVAAQEATRASLQAELDTALVQLGRRRARLAAVTEASGERILEQTAALRR